MIEPTSVDSKLEVIATETEWSETRDRKLLPISRTHHLNSKSSMLLKNMWWDIQAELPTLYLSSWLWSSASVHRPSKSAAVQKEITPRGEWKWAGNGSRKWWSTGTDSRTTSKKPRGFTVGWKKSSTLETIQMTRKSWKKLWIASMADYIFN